MSQLAHQISTQSVAPLVRLPFQSRSAQSIEAGIIRELESMARTLGKEIPLASEDYQLQLSQQHVQPWTALLQQSQDREQALHTARIIAHAGAKQLALHFAQKLAEQTAKQIQLTWKKHRPASPNHVSPSPAQTPGHPPTAAAASRPTTQPHGMNTRSQKAPLTTASVGGSVASEPRVGQSLALDKTQERIGGWPDSVPIFLFGLCMALFGLGLWRRAIHAENSMQAETLPHDQANPFVLLTEIQAPLQQLQQDSSTLDASQICQRIDDILARYVTPMTESRQTVINRLGMEAGAEILVIIAYAERMLNRVWSAASDDHLPEARSVLTDAVQAFAEAAQKTNASLQANR